MVFLTIFSFVSVDIDKFLKKDKPLQANIFVFLIIISIAYLAASFIINFMEASRII
jgi:uncharacterized membrane protein YwzB